MTDPDLSSEHHRIKRTLWQRWMAWSGSFLVLSILVHLILIGGATVLIVQVVQAKKEKLKFTAAPPSPAGPAEHKVKPTKKTAAAAPAASKRITSTAINASVALPAMDLNASTSPDLMAGVMSGMGASGLGAGAGTGAGAGMASMPLTGLTAFGFKGVGQGGLVGHLYDLKQTKDRQPSEIKDDGVLKDRSLEVDKNGQGDAWQRYDKIRKDPAQRYLLSDGIQGEAKVINEFLSRTWDIKVLEPYYKSPDALTAYQISIPWATQEEAVKAFGVEKEVKPSRFLIHYKGTVTAPRDGIFRFIALVGNGMFAIRFNGQNVFGNVSPLIRSDLFLKDPDKGTAYLGEGVQAANWMHLQLGQKYPIEILMTIGGQMPGNAGFACTLMIEEKNPATPYLLSEYQWQTKQGRQYQSEETLKNPNIYIRFPLFALKKGLSVPEFKIPSLEPRPNMNEIAMKWWKLRGAWPSVPDMAPDPLVFPGSK